MHKIPYDYNNRSLFWVIGTMWKWACPLSVICFISYVFIFVVPVPQLWSHFWTGFCHWKNIILIETLKPCYMPLWFVCFAKTYIITSLAQQINYIRSLSTWVMSWQSPEVQLYLKSRSPLLWELVPMPFAVKPFPSHKKGQNGNLWRDQKWWGLLMTRVMAWVSHVCPA